MPPLSIRCCDDEQPRTAATSCRRSLPSVESATRWGFSRNTAEEHWRKSGPRGDSDHSASEGDGSRTKFQKAAVLKPPPSSRRRLHRAAPSRSRAVWRKCSHERWRAGDEQGAAPLRRVEGPRIAVLSVIPRGGRVPSAHSMIRRVGRRTRIDPVWVAPLRTETSSRPLRLRLRLLDRSRSHGRRGPCHPTPPRPPASGVLIAGTLMWCIELRRRGGN